MDGWGDALWPYADPRAIDALNEIGIKVANAEDLKRVIERETDFDIINRNGGLGLNQLDDKFGNDPELQVQVEFVVLLERAVGCVLEKKVKELRRKDMLLPTRHGTKTQWAAILGDLSPLTYLRC